MLTTPQDDATRPGGSWERPHRTVIIVIVCLVGALVGLSLFGQLQSTPPESTAKITVDVAVAALSVALLPLLYRRAVPAAGMLIFLAVFSPTAVPTASVATIQLARVRPFRTAVIIAVAGAAAHLIRGLWRPINGLPYGWYVVVVIAVQAANMAWGARARSQRAFIDSLRDRARQAEAEQHRMVVEARLNERTRIAREMHDGLAHRLSLLATYSGALEFRPDASPERVAEAAGVIRAGVHQTLDELREVITLLRDEAEDPFSARHPLPGLDDLDQLVEESRAAGTEVSLDSDLGAEAQMPAPLGRTIFRVVQEGLTNARRHAPGETVTIMIRAQPGDHLEVIIRNVCAATPVASPGAGAGLIGLEERVHLAGGDLQYGRAGADFVLTARIPWPDGESSAHPHR